MIVKPRIACEGCFKPVARRLALFKISDEYECYAESYVKCFWGLCDLHKSVESIVPNTVNLVVTEQPKAQETPNNNQHMIQNVTIENGI